MIFETDLNYDKLYSFTEDELFNYIKENFVSPNTTYADGYSYEKSVKLMKVVCQKMLKISPSPEQWVFLLADCERLLCEACAGAGKTTMAQLRSIKDKLIHKIPGCNILALAYNTHAVEDMKLRHDSIIRQINNLNIPDLHRDTNICCYTFHSFCKGWVEDYLAEFGIVNKNNYLMSDSEKKIAMGMALDLIKKKQTRSIFTTDATVDNLLSLYSYKRETLTEQSMNAWSMCPSRADLAVLTDEQIAEIFVKYEKWKSLKRKMDFTDLISNMYLLCQRTDVMARIRANYSIFIVDEYQDMTPSMLRILRLITEGSEEFNIPAFDSARLTCIGDGDQSIYGFRGTDPDNCIRFKDTFNSPGHMIRVTAMSENRRCPSEIIKYARAVIESNKLRINKPIQSIRDGGTVNAYKYSSCDDQMNMIIQKIRQIPENELADTCICYRNRSSSYMLGLALEEAGIPFKIVKGHSPLTDKLSQSLFDVLNMLSYSDIYTYVKKALYKVIPKSSIFTKAAISDLLDCEEEASKNTGNRKSFTQIEYPASALGISGFTEALQILEHARVLHKNNRPMMNYIPDLIKLIRKYYLDWMNSKSKEISEEYIQYITRWFSRDISYDNFMKEYQELVENTTKTERKGVYCTTLHGLKGLEFKHVFIIDMSDSLFPGTELNQSKDLSASQKDVLECEARRLFYVALTRAKENLSVYFDSDIPSRYIRFFTPNKGLAESYKEYIHEDQGFLVANLGDAQSAGEELPDFDLGSIDIFSGDGESSAEPTLTAFNYQESETDVFRELVKKSEEQDARLKDSLGESRFDMIKDKGLVKNIIDRVLTEGATK